MATKKSSSTGTTRLPSGLSILESLSKPELSQLIPVETYDDWSKKMYRSLLKSLSKRQKLFIEKLLQNGSMYPDEMDKFGLKDGAEARQFIAGLRNKIADFGVDPSEVIYAQIEIRPEGVTRIYWPTCTFVTIFEAVECTKEGRYRNWSKWKKIRTETLSETEIA